MDKLIVNETEIRVDEHGRYSLTDLWKAGESIETKKPSRFERTDRHKELVNILKGRNLPFEPYEKTRGRYTGGTWATEEMIVAYAIYISADVHMQVIDVFLAAAKGEANKAVAIARNDHDTLKDIERFEYLSLYGESQEDRNEMEHLNAKIASSTSKAGRSLSVSRRMGNKKREQVLNDKNKNVQLTLRGLYE